MGYVSELEELADARSHVMANTGRSQEEAETGICQALLDGAINFRGELKLHTTKDFKARGTVLAGTAFQLPLRFDRGYVDWEKSAPRQPWFVKHGHYRLPGYWELERIRLSKADVSRVLCTPGEGGGVPTGESDTASKIRPAPEGAEAHIAPAPKPADGSQDRVMSARRRGRRPTKLTATVEAMRQDMLEERLTPTALANMLEKTLSANYGVSRDTARKARNAVLSEFHELNSRQNRHTPNCDSG